MNLRETLDRVLKLYSNRRCMGFRDLKTRKYVWLTHAEVRERVLEIKRAISSIPNLRHFNIGLCGRNDPSWILNDFAACLIDGSTVVGIHSHWQAKTLERILIETKVNVLLKFGGG